MCLSIASPLTHFQKRFPRSHLEQIIEEINKLVAAKVLESLF